MHKKKLVGPKKVGVLLRARLNRNNSFIFIKYNAKRKVYKSSLKLFF